MPALKISAQQILFGISLCLPRVSLWNSAASFGVSITAQSSIPALATDMARESMILELFFFTVGFLEPFPKTNLKSNSSRGLITSWV